MTTTALTTTEDTALLSAAQQAGVDLRAMLDLIPEADDDAFVNLIVQIANATSVEQIDAPWQSNGLKEYVGQPLEFLSLRRMASDFTEGLGFYLLCRCKVVNSGEIVTVSTGSVNIITQLLRVNALDGLPLVAIPVEAAKPSRNGYKPMHLQLVRG